MNRHIVPYCEDHLVPYLVSLYALVCVFVRILLNILGLSGLHAYCHTPHCVRKRVSKYVLPLYPPLSGDPSVHVPAAALHAPHRWLSVFPHVRCICGGNSRSHQKGAWSVAIGTHANGSFLEVTPSHQPLQLLPLMQSNGSFVVFCKNLRRCGRRRCT